MNKVILMGRLTSDPKMDWTRSEDSKQYATYTLAVNRRFKKNGQADADFISCIAWGAMAEQEGFYPIDESVEDDDLPF